MSKLFRKSSVMVCIVGLFLLSTCKDKDKDPPSPNIETNFPTVVELPEGIVESSGIICLEENHLWTHNDGGDEPVLYEIDLTGNGVDKSVVVADAVNKDWEAITNDDTVVFLADIGNNGGSRTDLTIHKISKADLLSQDSVYTSDIFFSYEDQTDFTTSDNHNFDCEAMISINDKLFLFTKNRGNLQTNIYTVSRNPGTQVAMLQDTLHVGGLITAAAINSTKDIICLLGYNIDGAIYNPFVWLLYDFPGTDFLGGKRTRVDFDLKKQTEAIYFKDDDTLYFTSEEEDGTAAYVYSFDAGKWMK